MPDNPPQPYEVGYGKPPVHSRFKEGHKGGPGRPKGSKNFSTLWKEEMEETFPIQGEDGKILRHSALRLAIRRLKNSALAGNIPAVVKLIEIQQRLEQAEQLRDDASVVPELSDEDYAIMREFLKEDAEAAAAAKRSGKTKPRKPPVRKRAKPVNKAAKPESGAGEGGA